MGLAQERFHLAEVFALFVTEGASNGKETTFLDFVAKIDGRAANAGRHLNQYAQYANKSSRRTPYWCRLTPFVRSHNRRPLPLLRESRVSKRSKKQLAAAYIRPGSAKPHGELVNQSVHVFVDDQNLFWGIQNSSRGGAYRIDFGRLLEAACKDDKGNIRFVKSAYIAGVIPDYYYYYWEIARKQGFTVRRGYLSSSGGQLRSKQDDAFLITEITSTLYEHPGPATIVLVAGDADYVPPLIRAQEKGRRVEVAFIDRGLSSALDAVTHQARTINPTAVKYIPNL